MTLPLSGTRVFEITSNVAGPYAGWILAQLGAEVYKIEPPTGDDARGWGPPFWNDTATIFNALNRDKKSAVVDLGQAPSVAALRAAIIESGDVVVQNLRPGALAKRGLDSDSLVAEKPSLIYCNLSAFGATGPMADRPGYDALLQAYTGVMSVTGEADGNPVRCGISAIDMGSGMWCAIGILAALKKRDLTGRGGVVDTSLFETGLAWMNMYALDFQVTGEAPQRAGSGVRNITPYRGFNCSDGQLIVAAPNDRLFQRLAKALGQDDWASDPRFVTSVARAENRHLLNDMIDRTMQVKTRAEWREILDAAGIPSAPIQDVGEVLKDPQTKALGMLQPGDDPEMPMGGLPLSFDGERPPARAGVPELGAHTKELFGD